MKSKLLLALAISSLMSSVSIAAKTRKWDPSVQANGKMRVSFRVSCLASGRIDPLIKVESVFYDIEGKKMKSYKLQLSKFNFEVRDSRELWVRTANDQAVRVGQLNESLDDLKLGYDPANSKVCADLEKAGVYYESVNATLNSQVQLIVNASDFKKSCEVNRGSWGTGNLRVKIAPQLMDIQSGEILATGESEFNGDCVSLASVLDGAVTAAVTPILAFFHYVLGWSME